MRNRMAGILIVVFSASGVVLAGQAARTAYGQTPSEAVSRSFTVANVAVLDPPTISLVISRSITVTNALVGDAPPTTEAFSHSITVCNVGNCAGDLNSDGGVSAHDLALLLGKWGCSDSCPTDLNCDGVVNAMDLTILLAHWGPCS